MNAQVLLKDIAEGMQMQSDEVTAFLNVVTGKVISVGQEEFSAAEENDDALGLGEDALQEIRDVAEGKDYIALPSQFDIHEHQILVRFADSVDNQSHSDQLHNALHGRGAFRRFKDTAYRLGIEKDWFAFRDKAYEDLAVEWCEENNIKYRRDEMP